MKKVGIITINDNNNYGNRLQNYAVQEVLKKINVEPITLKNEPATNTKNKYLLRKIKSLFNRGSYSKIIGRKECFEDFNRNINFSAKKITPYSKLNEYDYFVVGSDQVWNPNFGRLRDVDLLEFTESRKKISFSASFGVSKLSEEYNSKLKKDLKDFKAISVREDAGKEIIEEVVGRKDVQVLVDPTMLLTSKEWDKIAKKPKQLKSNRYILNYFLGELSEERKKEIERIAKENNCEIINILDKNSPFYQTGPSEFVYLEKNAFLVCTDSFHSCVFAILYDRPFIVFDREDSYVKMNSRLDTLLKKFDLENRWYKAKIIQEQLKADYEEAYNILEDERRKSKRFLENAIK